MDRIMIVTKVDVVVISVLVLAVAVICYTIGMWVRRDSDYDLIQELYKELDARKAEMPPEIAHEPRGYLEVPDWQGPDTTAEALTQARSGGGHHPSRLGTPIRDTTLIYRDPVDEAVAALEIRQALPVDGWDLDGYIESLVRRNDEFLAGFPGGES
jgi:hypothetical protein